MRRLAIDGINICCKSWFFNLSWGCIFLSIIPNQAFVIRAQSHGEMTARRAALPTDLLPQLSSCVRVALLFLSVVAVSAALFAGVAGLLILVLQRLMLPEQLMLRMLLYLRYLSLVEAAEEVTAGMVCKLLQLVLVVSAVDAAEAVVEAGCFWRRCNRCHTSTCRISIFSAATSVAVPTMTSVPKVNWANTHIQFTNRESAITIIK